MFKKEFRIKPVITSLTYKEKLNIIYFDGKKLGIVTFFLSPKITYTK